MGFELVCKKCGGPIMAGDRVISTNKSDTKQLGPNFYHWDCYDSLELDLWDEDINGHIPTPEEDPSYWGILEPIIVEGI